MFGLRPKLPLTQDERCWVEEGFARLRGALGRQRMLDCPVVEPTDKFFPDHYDGSEAALEAMFRRVCEYMKVPRDELELAVIPDTSDLMELLPEYSFRSNDAAGLHFGKNSEEKPLIGIKKSLLKDPVTVVATAAHELGHVILLDGGHISRDAEDMEPMTDLLTVYSGMGIFSANSCRRFQKFRDDRREGWSMKTLGYLPEVVYGYALALFARERGERNPAWARHLSTNVMSYFQKSSSWLEKNASSPSVVT